MPRLVFFSFSSRRLDVEPSNGEEHQDATDMQRERETKREEKGKEETRNRGEKEAVNARQDRSVGTACTVKFNKETDAAIATTKHPTPTPSTKTKTTINFRTQCNHHPNCNTLVLVLVLLSPDTFIFFPSLDHITTIRKTLLHHNAFPTAPTKPPQLVRLLQLKKNSYDNPPL